jgi:hypothetical protein
MYAVLGLPVIGCCRFAVLLQFIIFLRFRQFLSVLLQYVPCLRRQYFQCNQHLLSLNISRKIEKFFHIIFLLFGPIYRMKFASLIPQFSHETAYV